MDLCPVLFAAGPLNREFSNMFMVDFNFNGSRFSSSEQANHYYKAG